MPVPDYRQDAGVAREVAEDDAAAAEEEVGDDAGRHLHLPGEAVDVGHAGARVLPRELDEVVDRGAGPPRLVLDRVRVPLRRRADGGPQRPADDVVVADARVEEDRLEHG
eukprot:gene4635-biopygen7453